MKEAVLKRYNLSEDGYRQKFHKTRPEKGESPEQFIERLKNYLHRWVELAQVGKFYEGLCELVVKDHFLSICCKDLSVHLREKSPRVLEELSSYAERYLAAHNHELISMTGGSPASEDGNSTGEEEELRCYKCNQAGHKMKDCPENTRGRE